MANLISHFAALADPTRRAVFERLAKKPLSVGRIAKGLPVSRPAVSQHLKVLKDAGLILDERQGASRIYRVDIRGFAEMRAYLDRFWDRSLSAYKTAVEKEKES